MHTTLCTLQLRRPLPPPSPLPLGFKTTQLCVTNAEELGQSYSTMTTVVCLSPDSGDCYRIDVRLAHTAKRTMIISTTELAHKSGS